MWSRIYYCLLNIRIFKNSYVKQKDLNNQKVETTLWNRKFRIWYFDVDRSFILFIFLIAKRSNFDLYYRTNSEYYYFGEIILSCFYFYERGKYHWRTTKFLNLIIYIREKLVWLNWISNLFNLILWKVKCL